MIDRTFIACLSLLAVIAVSGSCSAAVAVASRVLLLLLVVVVVHCCRTYFSCSFVVAAVVLLLPLLLFALVLPPCWDWCYCRIAVAVVLSFCGRMFALRSHVLSQLLLLCSQLHFFIAAVLTHVITAVLISVELWQSNMNEHLVITVLLFLLLLLLLFPHSLTALLCKKSRHTVARPGCGRKASTDTRRQTVILKPATGSTLLQ